MKISTRLLLLFLMVAVLPLALFGYLNLQQYEATLRAETLGRMSGLTDKKVIQIRNYLEERVQDVRMLARSTRVMDEMIIMPREYPSRHLATARYAREDALTHHYFDRYVEDEGVFYDVFLITPQGEIIYSQKHASDFSTNLLTGPYRSSQLAAAFRAARMTLEPVISGYEHYAPSQAPALFIAAPIMVDEKFKGIFAVQLDNELFYKVATDATGLGQSGEVTFIQKDGDGLLVTTPLKYRTDAAMKLRLSLQQIKPTPMIGALSGESGEGVKPDYRGKLVVAAWRYLPELDWGMVVKIDADEVFASIYRQQAIMLGAMLGLLLFAGLVAYYFGRQISIPLKDMSQTVGEMTKGDLDKRADESAPGELGLFARAFNRMAENLQVLYRTLERRIELRTHELNVTNEQLRAEVIERKQIMKKLQESEESSRLVLERALDAVIMMDAEGRVAEWNNEAVRIFGYQRDEAIGKVLADLIIPPPQRELISRECSDC